MIESVVGEVAEGIAHGVSAVLLGNVLSEGKCAVLLRLLRLLRNCFIARAAQDLAIRYNTGGSGELWDGKDRAGREAETKGKEWRVVREEVG